jgi:hypothetical protein|tara:strand:+ start:4407 stop:4586 length:180 start_codon:yes stop_codon:yes gene_type:complete
MGVQMDRCIACGLIVEICGDLSDERFCEECTQIDASTEDDADFTLLGGTKTDYFIFQLN